MTLGNYLPRQFEKRNTRACVASTHYQFTSMNLSVPVVKFKMRIAEGLVRVMDVFSAPHIRNLILPICRDISPTLTGREFADLDPVRDASALKEVYRMANLVRYVRMGINPHWIPVEELECAQKLALSKGF
jgi:hypothetical protein